MLSQELISTGVKTKIIRENQVDGQWYNDNTQYTNEEKNLTLKILELHLLRNMMTIIPHPSTNFS